MYKEIRCSGRAGRLSFRSASGFLPREEMVAMPGGSPSSGSMMSECHPPPAKLLPSTVYSTLVSLHIISFPDLFARMDVSVVRSKFPALSKEQVFFDNACGSQILGTVVDSYVYFFCPARPWL